MSEYIGMKITIGGQLPANLIGEFLQEFTNKLNDITGPTTEKELRSEIKQNKPGPISWDATSNYGECDSLKSFCRKHKLGYVHTCEAKYEYNGETKYWIPGMKDEVILSSDQNGDAVVHFGQIKPLVDLLLDYVKQGNKILPLHIADEDEDVKDLIEIGLKSPKKFFSALEKRIREYLPEIPKLPPLTII